jgi:hypothetical protein
MEVYGASCAYPKIRRNSFSHEVAAINVKDSIGTRPVRIADEIPPVGRDGDRN